MPRFAIHGDADKIVPLELDSQLVRDRWPALGGEITLMVPPGPGQNVWRGFFESTDLVTFVVRRAEI